MITINKSSAIVLPYIYGKWVGQLLETPIPEEQAAVCDSCAMCHSGESAPNRQTVYFDPAVKCCTYTPELPNFLVGAILFNTDNAMVFGRNTIKHRLSKGVGVTPLGIFPSPSFTLLYRNSPAAFGRSQALSCPHFETESGRCGIWQYRPPPCITWFCKHNRGTVGRDFWRELNLLLTSAHHNLAFWCMNQLGIDTEAMRTVINQPQRIDAESDISADMLDGNADESWLRSVWGNWYGRQDEFYQRCARLTEDLDWSNVEALGGAEVQVRAKIVKAAHRMLTDSTVPTRVRLGSYQIVSTGEDYIRVTTYSPYDPLDIPKNLFDVMVYFHGRPLTDALNIITRKLNVPLNSKVTQTLLDFGVLIEEPLE